MILIPKSLTRLSRIQMKSPNRPNQIQMRNLSRRNRNLTSLNPKSLSRPSRLIPNPNPRRRRSSRSRGRRCWMSRTLIPNSWTQCLLNKQTDKTKRGSRGPRETVNDGASSIPPPNRPAPPPIVHGGSWHAFTSAGAHTDPAGARASFCGSLRTNATLLLWQLVLVAVLRARLTARSTKL